MWIEQLIHHLERIRELGGQLEKRGGSCFVANGGIGHCHWLEG